MRKILYRDNKNVLRETTVYEVVDAQSYFYDGLTFKPVLTNEKGFIDSSLLPPTSKGSGTTYYFSTPDVQWMINHNLGYYPLVELYSTGGAEIEGDVQNISVNQLIITFSTNIAGLARVS